MSAFIRFPHTPHLVWMGQGIPRDDKVLSLDEAKALLAGAVVVEEKLDGANLGVSVSQDGEVRVQNRGQYLSAPYIDQFRKINTWLDLHRNTLFDALGDELILFGEWCAARHSIAYDRLPDRFIVFDVYDRKAHKFWSSARRDKLSDRIGLPVVANIFHGRTNMASLKELVLSQKSAYYSGPLEGLIVRRESGLWLSARAKLVRADFTQSISEHWRRREIQWNSLQKATVG